MLGRELGAHLVYSWRERAKPLRGRVAAAHVVCPMFRVLCFVCCVVFACVFYNFLYLANQLAEINWDKGQISKLCATVNKKPPQKHPDIIRWGSVE